MGPACPRHCEGPRLFFLEGAHDWENVFVLCISHCLVLKQVLKEKMRETIGKYSTKTYSKLHSIDIRTGNTKDGWKKHGIDRQPFFWFGTPSNKIEMQMTKIPKESADQKDSVWYYQGSCMPKTLRGSKAILLGGSTWLSKCVRALHFPLLGFETGLERENAWNYWDIFYKDLLQVTFNIRTGNTKDGWKKHGINRQPFFWFGTPSNRITTKIPRESADQKDIVWYYHGSCMPKAILLGGSTWLSECVRALHFPLLGFETGLERENAWNYWDIFYKDLLQVTFDIRTGNTKDGWKKHGINRQPFFWFGTSRNKIEM